MAAYILPNTVKPKQKWVVGEEKEKKKVLFVTSPSLRHIRISTFIDDSACMYGKWLQYVALFSAFKMFEKVRFPFRCRIEHNPNAT